jgi:hypothetical protein
VFIINAPLQVSMYLLVACVGYYYSGSKASGYFLNNLIAGPLYQLASALLFCHVVIAFLIKNVVLARFVHGLLSPGRVNEESWRARIEYASCALFLTFAGSGVALVMPYFDDFLSLTGALLSGPISFLLPMIFFVGTLRRIRGCRSPSCPGQNGIEIQAATTTPMVQSQEALPLTAEEDPEKTLTDGLTAWDMLTWMVVGTIVVFTMVIGSFDSVHSMIKKSADAGGTFACKALNTTDLR